LNWDELKAETACSPFERGQVPPCVLLVVVSRTAIEKDAARLQRHVDPTRELTGHGRDCLLGTYPGAQRAAESADLAFGLEQRLSCEPQSGSGSIVRSPAP
jgi:hypothetical protein